MEKQQLIKQAAARLWKKGLHYSEQQLKEFVDKHEIFKSINISYHKEDKDFVVMKVVFDKFGENQIRILQVALDEFAKSNRIELPKPLLSYYDQIREGCKQPCVIWSYNRWRFKQEVAYQIFTEICMLFWLVEWLDDYAQTFVNNANDSSKFLNLFVV